MKKNKFSPFILVWVAIIFAVLTPGGYYIYNQQYQMAIRVTPDSENDPEWPSKRKWFDAKRWLKSPQYIKINEFYLLNTMYNPIDKPSYFGVTRRLKEGVKKSVNRMPELTIINNMDNNTFHAMIEKNYSFEYLRSRFNKDTLEPTDDYFLLFFKYKGKNYELQLLRSNYEGEFIFTPFGSRIHKAGYWHSISPKDYSYRDYLAGKPIK